VARVEVHGLCRQEPIEVLSDLVLDVHREHNTFHRPGRLGCAALPCSIVYHIAEDLVLAWLRRDIHVDDGGEEVHQHLPILPALHKYHQRFPGGRLELSPNHGPTSLDKGFDRPLFPLCILVRHLGKAEACCERHPFGALSLVLRLVQPVAHQAIISPIPPAPSFSITVVVIIGNRPDLRLEGAARQPRPANRAVLAEPLDAALVEAELLVGRDLCPAVVARVDAELLLDPFGVEARRLVNGRCRGHPRWSARGGVALGGAYGVRGGQLVERGVVVHGAMKCSVACAIRSGPA
jgi:hypothetical protein